MAKSKVISIIYKTLPKDLKWWIQLYNLQEKAKAISEFPANSSRASTSASVEPHASTSVSVSALRYRDKALAISPASASEAGTWNEILPVVLASAIALADGYTPGDIFDTSISTQSSLKIPLRKRVTGWFPKEVSKHTVSQNSRLVCRGWRDALPFCLNEEAPGIPAIRKGPNHVHGTSVFANRNLEGGQVIARLRGIVHVALVNSPKMRLQQFSNIPAAITGAPHAIALRPFKFSTFYPDGIIVHHKADAVIQPLLDGNNDIAFLKHACKRHANCSIIQTNNTDLCGFQLDTVHVHGKQRMDKYVQESLFAVGQTITVWCIANKSGISKDIELLVHYKNRQQFVCTLCVPDKC